MYVVFPAALLDGWEVMKEPSDESDALRAVRGLAWGFALSVPAWLLLPLVLWIIAGAA